MQTLGRDGHLSTKAHLPPIGEAGGGVDVHHRRVDQGNETPGIRFIFGEDTIRVRGGVRSNMLHGLFQPVDDL